MGDELRALGPAESEVLTHCGRPGRLLALLEQDWTDKIAYNTANTTKAVDSDFDRHDGCVGFFSSESGS